MGWAALAALVLVSYGGTLRAPFIFDDLSVVETLSHRAPLFDRIFAPAQNPLAGRPLVALSFVLNHAAGRLDVVGYHALNLGLHLLAAIALAGIARRTLESPALVPKYGAHAQELALTIAAVWLVHPLLTEAVIYVTQRTELLMGLFYFLTLLLAARAWAEPPRLRWEGLCVLSCGLGMASKETMVTAPLAVVLYDRAFRSEPWRELWKRRRRLYVALAATWLLLAALMLGGPRTSSVGFGLGVSPLGYLRTQLWAVPHYLRLALWPSSLCLDYGPHVGQTWADLWPGVVGLGLLPPLLVWTWRRSPPVAFALGFVFLVLAPTSSLVPIVTEPVAERRMYLPLAGLAALAVCGLHALWRLAPEETRRARQRTVAVLVVLSLTYATVRRGEAYGSALRIWADAIAKHPENARAHANLGMALVDAGRVDEALDRFRDAIRIDPRYAPAHHSLALALASRGRYSEALPYYDEALRLRPGSGEWRVNRGVALAALGRMDEGIREYETALRLEPRLPKAHYDLANALSGEGRLSEAEAEYRAALRADPEYPQAHNNLGVLLLKEGRTEEARGQFREALHIDPGYGPARKNLEQIR